MKLNQANFVLLSLGWSFQTYNYGTDMKVDGRMAYQTEVARSSGLMVASMLAVGAWRMECSNKEVPIIHQSTPVHLLPEIQRLSSPQAEVILR